MTEDHRNPEPTDMDRLDAALENFRWELAKAMEPAYRWANSILSRKTK